VSALLDTDEVDELIKLTDELLMASELLVTLLTDDWLLIMSDELLWTEELERDDVLLTDDVLDETLLTTDELDETLLTDDALLEDWLVDDELLLRTN
jgi:hypothetical protein